MIKESLLYRFGFMVSPLRYFILIITLLVACKALTVLPDLMTHFKSTGFVDESAPSVKTRNLIDKNFGYAASNQVMILYNSPILTVDSDEFLQSIQNSFPRLQNFPVKYDVLWPDANPSQRSKDNHSAYVIVTFYSQEPLPEALMADFSAKLKAPPGMTMHLGGEGIFLHWINQQTQKDLYKADKIALPVAVVVLFLVFGSIVAAFLPVLLGLISVLITLLILYILSQYLSLSIFTINIAVLLGLCLSLDYSLFIVSRFKQELKTNVATAVALTLASAGRSVFFSGLAVMVSLSALLFFPINILFSIGMGGLIAVASAVLMALVVLPAFLSILGAKINFGNLRKFITIKNQGSMWRFIATAVVDRAWVFCFLSLLLAIILSVPFFKAKFGFADYHIFPEHSQSRDFFDNYKKKFKEESLNPIILLVTADKDILSQESLQGLLDLTHNLKKQPGVLEVHGIVDADAGISVEDYYNIYANLYALSPGMQNLFHASTRHNMTLLRIVSKYRAGSKAHDVLIKKLRSLVPTSGLTYQWTGKPVMNLDMKLAISKIFPWVLVMVMLSTYVILLIVLQSLFLPLKAIFMNSLSLAASYGVLVYVFQEGHLQHFLHFTPQGNLDLSLVVIVFCAIFGFSMDYEVFLLTRIQEFFQMGKNNRLSIISGIEQSSRLITSAAMIVMSICASFMVADIVIIKEFGLGIAIAIFVDAFVIRSILVPATMMLLGSWNWYLPKLFHKLK
jgi:putative drug exporter of the RND superfamily